MTISVDVVLSETEKTQKFRWDNVCILNFEVLLNIALDLGENLQNCIGVAFLNAVDYKVHIDFVYILRVVIGIHNSYIMG